MTFAAEAKKTWHLLIQRLSVYENVRGFDAHIDAHIAFKAHTVFLHVLIKSVFRCYRNQSTRYFLSFKSRSDLRNATLGFFFIY